MHTFFGLRGKFSAGGILHGDNFPWVGNFPGCEFYRGNFTLGELPEFLYETDLKSCFHFADSILRVEILRVIVRGKFSPGLNCLENKYVGRREFLWRCTIFHGII